jgi:cytochrome b
VPDWARVAYWIVAGALVFAGFYLTFYGERSPYLLLAGVAMVLVGWFALGSAKAWMVLFGPLLALAVAFLLEIGVGL